MSINEYKSTAERSLLPEKVSEAYQRSYFLKLSNAVNELIIYFKTFLAHRKWQINNFKKHI